MLNALYIVATPIGNLQDISARAIHVLSNVDRIATEDTRHSKHLLSHLGINKPLVALHDHNERQQTKHLLADIHAGCSIALISDAGTPLISDPGYFIVKQAHEQNIRVIPIPGPSAIICALSASGLATDKFTFEGFLPTKEIAKLNALQELQQETRTMVFYESPHRIVSTLQTIQKVFEAERQVTLARELTKVFETIHTGNINDLLEFVQKDHNQQKGEIVLMLAGTKIDKLKDQQLTPEAKNLLKVLLSELSVKQAVSLAVKITKLKKRVLYEHAIKLKS